MNWKDERRLAKLSWPNVARACESVEPTVGLRCEHLAGHPESLKHTAKTPPGPARRYLEW